MKGFIVFIREQGVIGFAVGFILGGAISNLVNSFLQNIINPLIGLIVNQIGGLQEAALEVGTAKITWGAFVLSILNFIVLAAVIYISVKVLKLDKFDLKKK